MLSSRKKVGIIVQARMASTRLPRKIMKHILGEPMLAHCIKRLQKVSFATVIVIAAPRGKDNSPIIELAEKMGVKIFQGSEEDVLSRYYGAAAKYQIDIVVRVTSDCPLIDPAIVDRVIEHFLKNQPVDYVSNTIERTFPRGMDVEVFTSAFLKKADRDADKPYQREHVTPYILEKGRTLNYRHKKDLSPYRLTVDTAEDFDLIVKIYESLYPKNKLFDLETITQFLEKNPHLLGINKHIEQKTLKGS